VEQLVLSAPIIYLEGNELTITSTDDRTEKFVICVDGIEVEEIACNTPGIAYELSEDGSYYICTGIGEATDTDIAISNEIDGK
jgi:hypothetical protein